MKCIPTYGVWELWLWKRLGTYNFFKDNITSIFLESSAEPPTQNQKKSELEESKN
jgi:hypothetical protein